MVFIYSIFTLYFVELIYVLAGFKYICFYTPSACADDPNGAVSSTTGSRFNCSDAKVGDQLSLCTHNWFKYACRKKCELCSSGTSSVNIIGLNCGYS